MLAVTMEKEKVTTMVMDQAVALAILALVLAPVPLVLAAVVLLARREG